MKTALIAAAVACLAGCSAGSGVSSGSGKDGKPVMETMKLMSGDFKENGFIPAEFGCSGEGRPPTLSWHTHPPNTKSFALLMNDPDAPSGNFIHWMVCDIPATAIGIPRGGPLPEGSREFENDFGQTGYGGPCPPAVHRYVFTLYALDVAKLERVNKRNFATVIKQHAIATAILIGKYQR